MSARFGSDMGQLSSTIVTHNSIYECRISTVWDIFGKYLDEGMSDLNVHLAIWRMFMYTTLQALFLSAKNMTRFHFGSTKIYISRQITDSGMSDLQYYTRTTNLKKLFGDVKSPKKIRNSWSKDTGNYWCKTNGVWRFLHGDR